MAITIYNDFDYDERICVMRDEEIIFYEKDDKIRIEIREEFQYERYSEFEENIIYIKKDELERECKELYKKWQVSKILTRETVKDNDKIKIYFKDIFIEKISEDIKERNITIYDESEEDIKEWEDVKSTINMEWNETKFDKIINKVIECEIKNIEKEIKQMERSNTRIIVREMMLRKRKKDMPDDIIKKIVMIIE